jgi:hypothetical protein
VQANILLTVLIPHHKSAASLLYVLTKFSILRPYALTYLVHGINMGILTRILLKNYCDHLAVSNFMVMDTF